MAQTTVVTNTDAVDNEHPLFREMCKDWVLPTALMGGTAAMREKAQLYLPKFPKESPASYNARLQGSFLYNAYSTAIATLRGKVLSEPLRLAEPTPTQEIWVRDIDSEGRDLTQFTYSVFADMIDRGLTHILVDMPDNLDAESLRGTARARPYFVHIPANTLFAWYDSGFEQLTQIRYKTAEFRQSGEWSYEFVERIRVVTPEQYADYERTELVDQRRPVNNINRKKFELVEEPRPHTFGRIPLVTLYAERAGHMTADVPLRDLADKNLEYWQSASDQRNILHAARVPFFFATGMNRKDAQEMAFGPNRVVYTSKSAQEATFEPKQLGSESIQAGKQDLDDLKEEMALLAIEPMVRNISNETATRARIDSSKQTSSLKAWALNLKDALERAFALANEMTGQAVETVIEMDTSFGMTEEVESRARLLWEARKGRDMSRQQFWSEWLALGMVSEEFDIEQNELQLREERDQNLEDFGMPGNGEDDGPGPFASADDDDEEDDDSQQNQAA